MSRTCIIPSAGNGTRFKELGKTYPKSLLPYNNKPIIQYNIEKVYDSVDEINVVVKRGNEDLFKEILSMYNTYDKINISVPDESSNSGPLTSIWGGRPTIPVDEVLIILSDIIVESDLDFTTPFISYQTVTDWNRWCLVNKEAQKNVFYDKVEEKPDCELKALNGVYFVTNNDFNKIGDIISTPKEQETQISFWLEGLNLSIVEAEVRDFGTLEEYQNERKLPNCRYFNEVTKDPYIVTKSSDDYNKMYKEFSWFQNIPYKLKPFTVRTFGLEISPCSYSMESVSDPTLREHLLFIGTDGFDKVLTQIKDYIEIERIYSGGKFYDTLYNKTKSRMQSIFTDDEVQSVLSRLELHKELIESSCSIMHGDMVASNIFFNETTNEIKLIDPRGDLYGTFLYDLAKLNQSLTTPYDYIDSGLYVDDYIYQRTQLKYNGMWVDWLNENYKEYVECIEAITLSLMCSLIPLHADTPKNQELYIKWCKENI